MNPVGQKTRSFFQGIGLKHLLIASIIVHVSATVFVNVVGQTELVPSMIYSRGEFQEDAFRNFNTIERLTGQMLDGKWAGIADKDISIETRVYAVSHFVFSPITGNSTLSFIPVNVLLYLGFLAALFGIANRFVDRPLAISAVFLFGMLPSLLLHFTQPLRDPMFITAFTALIYAVLSLMRRAVPHKERAVYLIVGSFSLVLAYFVRDRWIILLAGILLLAFGTVVLRSIVEKRVNLPVHLSVGVLFILGALSPVLFGGLESKKEPLTPDAVIEIEQKEAELIAQNVPSYLIRLNRIRGGFQTGYDDAGSRISDSGEIVSLTGLLATLPKAALNGFFAPFPNTWFGEGKQYGRAGRLLAGVEMLFAYVALALGIIGLLMRFDLRLLFLAASLTAGLTALGLVVLNAGAIHRMRLSFWALLLILAVNGCAYFLPNRGGEYSMEGSPAETS